MSRRRKETPDPPTLGKSSVGPEMNRTLRMHKSVRKFLEDMRRETVRPPDPEAIKKFHEESAKFSAALVAGLNKGVMKDDEPE